MRKFFNCTVAPPTGASSPMVAGTTKATEHAVAKRRCAQIAASPPRVVAAAVLAAALIAALGVAPAAADLGPCRTSAPTTRDVHLFVSDVDRAVRWYRDNAGLAEQRRWIDETFGGATLVSMQRGPAGVTLVSWPREVTPRFRDPQMVCLVLDGPPAPVAGTAPLFLADPDGTSVELPPAPAQPATTSERK